MTNNQEKFQSWVKEYSDTAIEIGCYILVPAVDGRRQKKKTGYGKVLDMVIRQSGEVVILIEQNRKRLELTQRDLDRCWFKISTLVPKVKRGDLDDD